MALLWFFTYTVTFAADPGVRVLQFIEVTCWVQFLSQYIPNGPVVSTAETLTSGFLEGENLAAHNTNSMISRRISVVVLLLANCLALSNMNYVQGPEFVSFAWVRVMHFSETGRTISFVR